MMEPKIRCGWCEKDDLYRNYHDTEWGKPVYDDAVLFEFLLLETFQAGLSWYTILSDKSLVAGTSFKVLGFLSSTFPSTKFHK